MAAPMDKIFFSSILELSTNSVDIFLDASEILLKIADNILNNERLEKYRQLGLSNPIIESKLLTVAGAMECLFQMGFEESSRTTRLKTENRASNHGDKILPWDGEYLRYPMTKPLLALSTFRDQLQAERQLRIERERSPQKTADSSLPALPKTADVGPLPSLPAPPVRDPTRDNIGPQRVDLASKMNVLVSEQKFFHKLQSNLMHVLIYEDSALQQRARDLIPLQEFLVSSGQKALNAKSTVRNGEIAPDVRDFLLLELLSWFKNSFFKWVDCPECSNCGKATERRGMVHPTTEEVRFGANRVEGFFCTKCLKHERFPRFNQPGKLLETRRGRCGEWANCFTLCCRALGFEARYVLDWTDHVWTEVFSHSQSRWLHCDPCENICDKPLIYEAGWGKKLTYIIAFSKDDIKDVTWRYTRNVEQVLKRRKECREDWLVNTILNMRERKQKTLSEIRRTELLTRSVGECSELLMPKDVKHDDDMHGRTSGSLSWRVARGEAGLKPKNGPFVIRPNQNDLDAKSMTISYNCASDEYTFSNGSVVKGFREVAHETENVFRKEEQDWKMVYLAVEDGQQTGSIEWKVDLSVSGRVIDEVTVSCESTTFEKGRVDWRICSDNSCSMIIPGQKVQITDFSGEKELTLKAVLTAGSGPNGWQHAQLFRQKIDDKTTKSFQMTVTFK